MISLLVDVNLDGHAAILHQQLQSAEWSEYRELIEIQFLHFEDVGLDRDEVDQVVWRLCQREGYWLLTANRNEDDDESLSATLQREGTDSSIPVLTLSNAGKLYQSRSYLYGVTRRLIEILLYAEQHLGTGRIYLP